MTTPKKKEGVSISATREPVAGFVEIDGTEYDVLKLNGDQFERVEKFGDTTPVTDLFKMAQEVCPSMPADVLKKQDRDSVGVILLLAGQGIAAVRALFPNVESPEPPTSPG